MTDNEDLVRRARTAVDDGALNGDLLMELADALEDASMRPRRAEIESKWDGPDWSLAGKAAYVSPLQRPVKVTIESPTGDLFIVDAPTAHITATLGRFREAS